MTQYVSPIGLGGACIIGDCEITLDILGKIIVHNEIALLIVLRYNEITPGGGALVLFTGGGSPGAVKTYPNSADKPP